MNEEGFHSRKKEDKRTRTRTKRGKGHILKLFAPDVSRDTNQGPAVRRSTGWKNSSPESTNMRFTSKQLHHQYHIGHGVDSCAGAAVRLLSRHHLSRTSLQDWRNHHHRSTLIALCGWPFATSHPGCWAHSSPELHGRLLGELSATPATRLIPEGGLRWCLSSSDSFLTQISRIPPRLSYRPTRNMSENKSRLKNIRTDETRQDKTNAALAVNWSEIWGSNLIT